MAHKARNPTTGSRQGFDVWTAWTARSDIENTASTLIAQDLIAARWLARRVGLSLATANAVASANAWGRQ